MEDFDSNLTAGNVKAAMKDAGAVSADLWQVAPDRLRVLEGFNARVKNEAYTGRVRWIADSIKANGYYKDKPLSGFVAREDGVDVIYVTGGHRRHEAVHLAISEGVEVPHVPVVIKPKGTGMEDLTVDLIVGNEGEPLTTYEQAVVCKRLAGFGWDSKEIARRVGYSTAQYVDGLLALAGAPLPIRKMVIESVISATTAIEAIKKHGDKATDVLLAAVVKAGGGRVTAKAMPGAEFKKAVKKQAEPMYTALTKVQADPGYAMLSGELRHLLEQLLTGIKK
jgi:ParB family transcriptional regulator, chromosome partitioning protein